MIQLADVPLVVRRVAADQRGEPCPAPPVAIYRNSPQEVAPEDLLTDIYVPLESR